MDTSEYASIDSRRSRYHSTSAPEKALRRPSVATLYPASMTAAVSDAAGDAGVPATSDGAARQTEDVV